jgi:hypothetical protein
VIYIHIYIYILYIYVYIGAAAVAIEEGGYPVEDAKGERKEGRKERR